jgi:hypothetical protein
MVSMHGSAVVWGRGRTPLSPQFIIQKRTPMKPTITRKSFAAIEVLLFPQLGQAVAELENWFLHSEHVIKAIHIFCLLSAAAESKKNIAKQITIVICCECLTTQ